MVGLEAVEVVKNADRTADLVTVPCVFGGCGEDMKASAASGCGFKWQQKTSAAYINCWF